jgi:hypothetical protein
MGLIGSPETSVLNHHTPSNNPEDGKIQQLICQIICETVQAWPLKMRPVNSPETSITTHLKARITQKTE